jgi:iron complex outermembrane recepter protein
MKFCSTERQRLVRRAVAMALLSSTTWAATAAAAEEDAVPAATNAEASAGNLAEITVTARKRSENLKDIPAAVSALSSDTLTSRGIPSIKQLDQQIPNLTQGSFGAGNISVVSIFIRGQGTGDHFIFSDPAVGLYLDGVYLGRNVGANLGLMNVDHVEVLRGPQGTLSGRNTLGGAINIVTRQPDQSDHFEFTGQLGTRERANGAFYASTPITDTFAISMSGSYEHRAGLGNFINLKGVDTRVGQIDQASGRVAAKWDPTSKLDILFSLDGMQGRYGAAPIRNTIINPNGYLGLTQADFPSNINDLGTENYAIPNDGAKSYGTALTGSYRFDDHLSAKIIGSQRTLRYKSGLDDDNSPLPGSEFPEIGHSAQTTGEAQLNGEYGKVDFVSGLYYFRESGWVQQDFTYNYSTGKTFGSQETTSYAAYAHAGYELTDALKLSGGVRYSHDHKHATLLIGTVDKEASWSAPTWDIALNYKLTPDYTAYATVQRGYQSGGFPGRPGSAAQVVAYNPTYATNFEGGLKGTVSDWLRFSGDVFYTKYTDLLVGAGFATPTGFVGINVNAAASRSYGVEFEGTVSAGSHFAVNGSMGYQRAQYTEIGPQVTSISAADTPPGIPQWTASLGPEVKTEVGSGNTLSARFDASYRSSESTNPVNGLSYPLPARFLANFDISYNIPSKGMRFSLYGQNIFNKIYAAGIGVNYDAGYLQEVLNNDRSEFGIRFRKTL